MNYSYPLLIQAKLSCPPVVRLFVDRARLARQLDGGLDGHLTLVCAPAGFGKTLLVSAWAESLSAARPGDPPIPTAWLALDESDNDPIIFMHYFIAALRTCFTGVCLATENLLHAATPPDPATLAAYLSNDISALPSRIILILDDYSVIEDERVHGIFNALIRHWPRQLHLVLTTRRDPPWRLAQLRANGLVADVRTGDLRFTREETAAYMALRWPGRASEAVLDLLDRAMEGWIVGLQLAMLSLSNSDLAEGDFLARLADHTQFADYLFDAVLSVQPCSIRTFMVTTSLLERFSGPLAAAIMADGDPECGCLQCLESIVAAELFIGYVDLDKKWYSYHPLFRSFLQTRLAAEFTPEQVRCLHVRAAEWFASQGLLDEALRHATAGGNLQIAAHLIEGGLRDLLNRGDPATLQRWLKFFPDDYVARRPGLLMARAWAMVFSGQLGSQGAVLDNVERLLAEQEAGGPATDELPGAAVPGDGTAKRLLRGQLLMLRGQIAFFGAEFTRAAALCDEAFSLVPDSWTYVRGMAIPLVNMARWNATGDVQVVRRLLDQYGSLVDKTDQLALRFLMAWGFIASESGHLEQLAEAGRTLLHQASRDEAVLMRNWGHYFLGVAHYCRNELEAAEQHFQQMVEHRYTANMGLQHDGFAGLALTQQARGKTIEARQTVELIRGLDTERIGHEDHKTRSLTARLQLLQGRLADAGRWADAFTDPVPQQVLLWLETPHLTRARVLIARNHDADVRAAIEILDALLDLAISSHNTQHRLEILVLHALAFERVGRSRDAFAALRQAVVLARPGGYVRLFVECGPAMKSMLERLRRMDSHPEFCSTILAAFDASDVQVNGTEPTASIPGRLPPGRGPLVEPLTDRELDVLALLAVRLSNKEIAEKLFLSPTTVKRHTVNIYDKLGVHRRAQAVQQAIELGILPQH